MDYRKMAEQAVARMNDGESQYHAVRNVVLDALRNITHTVAAENTHIREVERQVRVIQQTNNV